MNTNKKQDDHRLEQLHTQYKKLLSSYRLLKQRLELLQAENAQIIKQTKCSVNKARQETANARARANRFKTKLQEFQSQNITI